MSTSNTSNAAVDNAVFNKSFLGKLRRVLETKCVGGSTMTREQACQDLGIDPALFQGTISALVNSGAVEGFEIKRGPYGGIGKVGEKRVLPAGSHGVRTRKSEQFSAEFLELVSDTLDEMTSESPEAYVRRIDVANKMGMPGSDTENAISLAINSGKVPGYESKRGAGGGIRRAQETTASTTPVPEAAPVSQAAPVSAKPEIFKGKAPKKTKAAAPPQEEAAPVATKAPVSQATGNQGRIFGKKGSKKAA